MWATCRLPGLWCCFYGNWHVSHGGSARCTGAEGAGSARFSLSDPLQEGPWGAWRESHPPPLEGWIHRSTELGVCAERTSSLAGTGSLWDFGWGMGEGDGTGERLCSPPSCSLSSGAQQLPLPLSSSPPALQADLLTYNLPDVKSRLLSEHTPSGPSTFASQTRGALLGWQAAPPPWLPPASPWSTHRLSALPTLFCEPLV